MTCSKSTEDMKRDLEQFIGWVREQPQLPTDLGDKLLHRFLHSCYYDVEKAKTAVKLFCTMRASSPDLVNNRDPHSESVQKTFKIINLAQLKISGNRNLWIWQLNDPGLEKYDYVQDARAFFLSTDSWLLDDDADLEESDIVLLDVKDITLKFITKFNVSVARKLAKYQEEALPIRLKQIHLVNSPSVIDKIHGLMKPFMRQDYCDMIQFHPPNSETLFDFFSKDELPNDYGGNRGYMADLMKDTLQRIEEKRKYFLNESLWKIIDLKKSKGNKTDSNADGGSFRKLDID